jgi:hypothetical protein
MAFESHESFHKNGWWRMIFGGWASQRSGGDRARYKQTKKRRPVNRAEEREKRTGLGRAGFSLPRRLFTQRREAVIGGPVGNRDRRVLHRCGRRGRLV